MNLSASTAYHMAMSAATRIQDLRSHQIFYGTHELVEIHGEIEGMIATNQKMIELFKKSIEVDSQEYAEQKQRYFSIINHALSSG